MGCSPVHSIDRAFLRKGPIAWPQPDRDPGSRGGLSSGAHCRDLLGQAALRAQRDLLNRIKLMLPVQSPSAKIFPFPSNPNHLHVCRIPAHTTGAFRDRHERKVRMRWTRAAPKTRALLADGEVVWS